MFAKICLAGIYRIAYKLHHLVCLKPGKPLTHARLIVVGSHLVGGAGKTPFSAWLAANLHEGKLGEPCDTIAILCHSSATDEAEMLREKLPFATVVATGNRYRTAHQLPLHHLRRRIRGHAAHGSYNHPPGPRSPSP